MDRLFLAIKVFSTLDYLKLCAQSTHRPTGEGIPLSIVVMPDFVVDVDGAAITKLNLDTEPDPTGMLTAIDIGSRAGRILSILGQLRDMDDQQLELHYIAKTGAVGRAVLAERFGDVYRRNNLQPVSFPLLSPGEHTRFSAINRDSFKHEQEVSRYTLSARNWDFLTSSELQSHFYDPLKTISQAAGIYFGTDTQKQFEALLGTTLRTAGSAGRAHESHLVIDCSALHNDKAQPTIDVPSALLESMRKEIVDARRKRSEEVARLHLTILIKLPDPPSGRPSRSGDPSAMIRRCFSRLNLTYGVDAVIGYNSSSVFCYEGGEEAPHRTRIHWKAHHVYGREALVAGYLLYRAVGSAWMTLASATSRPPGNNPDPNWTRDLFPDPFADPTPSTSWPVAEAVEFGAALGSLWQSYRADNPPVPSGNDCSNEIRDRDHVISHLAVSEPSLKNSATPANVSTMASLNPKQWLCAVYRNTHLWREKQLSKTAKRDFCQHLYKVVGGVARSEWKDKQASVLHTTSFETLRAHISLSRLRRLSGLEPNWDAYASDAWKKGRRALIADLDGTLLWSSELRNLCLRRAFLSMLLASDNNEQHLQQFPVVPAMKNGLEPLKLADYCVRLYKVLIYDRHAEWKEWLAGFVCDEYKDLPRQFDFREVWNHPLSYPVFFWLLYYLHNDFSISIPPDISPMRIAQQAFSAEKTGVLHEAIARGSWDDKKFFAPRRDADVSSELEAFRHQWRTAFEAGVEQYWHVAFAPFGQTGEVFRTLRDVFGVAFYIATEGHQETQLRKVQVCGLQRFFPRHSILSTSAAADPHEETRLIEDWKSKEKDSLATLEGKNQGVRELVARMMMHHGGVLAGSGGTSVDEMNVRLEYLHSTVPKLLGDLKSEREKLGKETTYLDIYSKQWKGFGEKKLGTIYSLAVTSIVLEPQSPFRAFTSLRELARRLHSKENVEAVQFAMIGDREEKDIAPFLERWKDSKSGRTRIATVCLMSADHYDENAQKRHAESVVWTPCQGLLLMCADGFWKSGLGREDFPAIFSGSIVDGDGIVDDVLCDAMAWGEGTGDDHFATANSLVVYSTYRSGADKTSMINAILDAIEAAAEKEKFDRCDFLWRCAMRILHLASQATADTVRALAKTVRDAFSQHCITYKRQSHQPSRDFLKRIKEDIESVQRDLDALSANGDEEQFLAGDLTRISEQGRPVAGGASEKVAR
jgi:hypothetical protein